MAFITGARMLANGTMYVPVSSAEEVMAGDPKYSCCTFRGSVSAVDAETGTVRWKSYTILDKPKPTRKNKQGVQQFGPSGAAVWSSPTVDVERRRVYVTTGDGYSDPVVSTVDAFVAFDMDTGKIVWSRQLTMGDAFTVDCDFLEALPGNCPESRGPDFDFASSPMLSSCRTIGVRSSPARSRG